MMKLKASTALHLPQAEPVTTMVLPVWGSVMVAQLALYQPLEQFAVPVSFASHESQFGASTVIVRMATHEHIRLERTLTSSRSAKQTIQQTNRAKSIAKQ